MHFTFWVLLNIRHPYISQTSLQMSLFLSAVTSRVHGNSLHGDKRLIVTVFHSFTSLNKIVCSHFVFFSSFVFDCLLFVGFIQLSNSYLAASWDLTTLSNILILSSQYLKGTSSENFLFFNSHPNICYWLMNFNSSLLLKVYYISGVMLIFLSWHH